MVLTFLFIGRMFVGFLGSVLNKRFQLGFNSTFLNFMSYNLLNALFASVYFFIANGFSVSSNAITLLFSFLFGSFIIIGLTLSIKVLEHVPMTTSAVASNSGGAFLPALFGIFFLSEPFSLRLLFSLVLILLAIVLPARSMGLSFEKNSLWLCLALFFQTGAQTIIQKVYTLTPGVLSTYSFFLMTNLVIAAFCAAVIAFCLFKQPKNVRNILMPFSKSQVGIIAAQTLISNIGSVITIFILARMNASVYTVISTSIGMITAAIVSRFVYKEPFPRENKIAIALSIAAGIISKK